MAPSLSDIEQMKQAGDIQSLIATLAASTSPRVRAAAAIALGSLMDIQASEPLIQAALSDSSIEVRTAASAALHDLLGNEADAALQSYSHGMPDTPLSTSADETEEEDDEEEEEDDEDEEEDGDEAVEDASEVEELPVDLPSLVAFLENADTPADRAAAAVALGDLADLDATEALIRAIVNDKSARVRAAATEALKTLLGDQAEAAFENYIEGMADIPDEPSAGENEEEGEADEEDGSWNLTDLDGLLRVLTDERNPVLKIRACKALAEIHDLRAASALAAAALSDDRKLQKAAYAALESMLGDSTQSFIDSFKLKEEREDEADTQDEAEFDEEEEAGEDDSLPYEQASSALPSVFEEEGQGARRWLRPVIIIIVIILLALALMRYFPF